MLFCVLPVLGGVALSDFFNPSTAKVLLLLMEIKAGIHMLGGVRFVVLPVFGGVADFNLRNPFIARVLCRLKAIKTGLPRLGGVFVFVLPVLGAVAILNFSNCWESVVIKATIDGIPFARTSPRARNIHKTNANPNKTIMYPGYFL